MKIITATNISIFLRDFTYKFLKKNNLISAYDINNGLCDDWATKVNEILPETEILGTPDYYFMNYEWAIGHYWIKYKGKHYDAETLKGAKNWKNLLIFKNKRK